MNLGICVYNTQWNSFTTYLNYYGMIGMSLKLKIVKDRIYDCLVATIYILHYRLWPDKLGRSASGVYISNPAIEQPFNVYSDTTTDGGGWMVCT